jgi:hypothetical protein
MVFVPRNDNGSGVIPCLYYTNPSVATRKLAVYFHGTVEDLGSEGIQQMIAAMGLNW